MRYGILLHTSKTEGIPVAEQVIRLLRARGLHAICNASAGLSIDAPTAELLTDEAVVCACDILIVIGGDGSLLRAATLAAPLGKPIWGINVGRLGFLVETSPAAVEEALDRVEKGDFQLERRMMVGATADGKSFTALNEIVLMRRLDASMLRVDVHVGQQKLDRFVSDGLLVASPTGSTAYWLSCGGAVVEPSLECLLLAAICPHSLRTRPVILPPNEVITAQLDGQVCAMLCDGDVIANVSGQVSVYRAAHSAQFIRFQSRNYYALLQMKMAEW